MQIFFVYSSKNNCRRRIAHFFGDNCNISFKNVKFESRRRKYRRFFGDNAAPRIPHSVSLTPHSQLGIIPMVTRPGIIPMSAPLRNCPNVSTARK